jgi:hypothetical protein
VREKEEAHLSVRGGDVDVLGRLTTAGLVVVVCKKERNRKPKKVSFGL